VVVVVVGGVIVVVTVVGGVVVVVAVVVVVVVVAAVVVVVVADDRRAAISAAARKSRASSPSQATDAMTAAARIATMVPATTETLIGAISPATNVACPAETFQTAAHMNRTAAGDARARLPWSQVPR
jgi:hypothetical protein